VGLAGGDPPFETNIFKYNSKVVFCEDLGKEKHASFGFLAVLNSRDDRKIEIEAPRSAPEGQEGQ
jgi:hypothetical protein